MAAVPLLFEIGSIRSGTDSTPPVIQTLLIHALVVGPNSIAWSDPPRDAITESVGGATHTKSDRITGFCQISGTFGYSERAFGTTTGSGPARQKRFENEVVQLPGAATREKVDEVIRNASIGLVGLDSVSGIEIGNSLAKKLASFDPRQDVLFVNLYDFYNRRFHRVGALNYRTTLNARGGGAVGMQQYNLSLTAYGSPIVANAKSVASKAIQGLTDILPTWQKINEAISSLTTDAALESLASAGSIVAETLRESIAALSTQVEALTSLAGGSVVVDNQGLSSLLGTVSAMIKDTESLIQTLTGTTDSVKPYPTTTEIDWSTNVTDTQLDKFAQLRTLETLSSSLDFQRISGRFLGMADADYAAFLETGGSFGGISPNVGSTIEHRVTSQDTPDRIATRYGTTWVEIVRVNRIVGEDIYPGRILQIPRKRPWGTPGVAGLPVLGSHIADSALGSDLQIPLTIESGDFSTVFGIQCLEQGVTLRKYKLADAVLSGLESIPPEVVAGVVAVRARLVLEADPRLQTVRTSAAVSGDTVALRADMQTVNGMASKLRTEDIQGQGARWDFATWDAFNFE